MARADQIQARDLDPFFVSLLTAQLMAVFSPPLPQESVNLELAFVSQCCHGNSLQTYRMKDPHFVRMDPEIVLLSCLVVRHPGILKPARENWDSEQRNA